jgi:hypothetical protein
MVVTTAMTTMTTMTTTTTTTATTKRMVLQREVKKGSQARKK